MEVDEAQIKAWDEYIIELKSMYKNSRRIGLVLCLIGAILYLGAVWLNGPDIVAKGGILIIGFGWVIFAYVIVKRTKWARENRPKMK